MSEVPGGLWRRPVVWRSLLVAAVGLSVLLLNPWREMPLEDDWAYARIVEWLIAHGRYRLHPWISANMPFQAVWGALFQLLLGHSFRALRISTLILSCGGLFACYRLLKSGTRSEAAACLGTLVLWFSPVYLRFSLNFMTDVPFTALVLLSLWLYMRAWRRMSYGWMAGAALAGTAAVLTRQFAVALIPAMLVAAWMRRSENKVRGLVVLGVCPLAVAAIYQIASGILHPTWAQEINLRAQHQLMGNPREFAEEFLWRPGVLLQYLCLFTLPLSLGAIAQLVAGRLPARFRTRGYLWACIGAAVMSGVSFAAGAAAHKDTVLPRIPWNLEGLELFGTPLRGLTVLTLMAGVPLAGLMVVQVWRDFRTHANAILIHTAMLCLLPLTLVYHQFGDEYLLVYVPWVIWSVSRAVPLRSPFAILCALGTLLLQLAIVLPWEDYVLAYTEVQWQAATTVVEHYRLAPTKVYAGWTWDCYYAFDEYTARFPAAGQVNFDSLFVKWLPEMERQAEYRVITGYPSTPAPPGTIVARRRTLLGRFIEARAEKSP